MNEKLTKEQKNFYSREFYQYWDNKKRLEQYKNMNSRIVLYLIDRISSIENVIKELKDSEKEIFYMIFKENRDWLSCKMNMNIDKNTYYHVLNKCLYALAQEFGEI